MVLLTPRSWTGSWRICWSLLKRFAVPFNDTVNNYKRYLIVHLCGFVIFSFKVAVIVSLFLKLSSFFILCCYMLQSWFYQRFLNQYFTSNLSSAVILFIYSRWIICVLWTVACNFLLGLRQSGSVCFQGDHHEGMWHQQRWQDIQEG